jgi:hypothetical protein
MSKSRDLIKKIGKTAATEIICSGENGDCVVRAIQHSFNVDYLDAHHFCEVKLHRNAGEGTYTGRYLHLVKQAFGLKINMMGRTLQYGNGNKRLTRLVKHKTTKWSNAKQKWIPTKIMKKVPYKVKGFIKEYSEGSYIVVVRRHAFALVNGVVMGNFEDDKRLTRDVVSAYKVG